jgi:hypothetical protein
MYGLVVARALLGIGVAEIKLKRNGVEGGEPGGQRYRSPPDLRNKSHTLHESGLRPDDMYVFSQRLDLSKI